MRKLSFPLIGAAFLAVNFLLTLRAETEIPPSEPWYVKSIKSADYLKATANDPRFDNKELWPEEMQKAEFMKQTWPKTRVLVWAGGSSKDGWEAKYWLEDGKPATVPFDENTDLVFPDRNHEGWMDWISITHGRKYQPAAFRHLTVGQGWTIVGHFSVGGNTWIKKGGGVRFLDSCVGKENTFLRNDNGDIRLVDHFHFTKASGSFGEMIGQYSSDDNWQIDSGVLILSPDSRIGAGNRTDPEIHENAALAIMSGSYFSRRQNSDWGYDLIVKGKFSAGLPDRPLTRDARLGLGYKSKGSTINNDASVAPGNRMPSPADFGMILEETGSFNVYADATSSAHLVLNCHKLDQDWVQLGVQWSGRKLDPVAGRAAAEAVPKLSDMVLLGKADMSNVRFEDIMKGGIHMADPAMAAQWKNVELGPNNGGTLQELVVPYKKP